MADQSPEYGHGQAGLSSHEVHWRYNALLDVPPVFLVTKTDPMDFRMAMAGFVDGRNVNDFEITPALPELTVEDREPAIQAVKDFTRGRESLTFPDRFADGKRYRHVFENGLCRHSYRGVVAFVPEVHRT